MKDSERKSISSALSINQFCCDDSDKIEPGNVSEIITKTIHSNIKCKIQDKMKELLTFHLRYKY